MSHHRREPAVISARIQQVTGYDSLSTLVVTVENVQYKSLVCRDTCAHFGEFGFRLVTVGALPERHVADCDVEISGEPVKVFQRRSRHALELPRKLDAPPVHDGDAVANVSYRQ